MTSQPGQPITGSRSAFRGSLHVPLSDQSSTRSVDDVINGSVSGLARSQAWILGRLDWGSFKNLVDYLMLDQMCPSELHCRSGLSPEIDNYSNTDCMTVIPSIKGVFPQNVKRKFFLVMKIWPLVTFSHKLEHLSSKIAQWDSHWNSEKRHFWNCFRFCSSHPE